MVEHEFFADDGVLAICNNDKIRMDDLTSPGLEVVELNGCELVSGYNACCPLSPIVDCFAV